MADKVKGSLGLNGFPQKLGAAVRIFILICVLLPGCARSPTAAPTSEAPATDTAPPVILPTAIIVQPTSLAMLSEDETWEAWVQVNHHPIRSLTSDDFSDLQWLKPLLQDKRIVQLGESSHGAAEFDQLKVRLTKFLHQELGFNVIAFESAVFECFQADQQAAHIPALDTMTHSIFRIWHTSETLPLFEYLQETKDSKTPLTLAGFDVQPSSPRLGALGRPEFLRTVVAAVDPTYAQAVFERDSVFFSDQMSRQFVQAEGDQWVADYETLVAFLDENMNLLKSAFSEDPRLPLVARQVAWSMGQYVRCLQTQAVDPGAFFDVRDPAMAENLDFLLHTLYSTAKVVIWAHNVHVHHAGAATSGDIYWCGRPSMGTWVAAKYRPELYTIGFFAHHGQTATVTRQLHDLPPPSRGDLEDILHIAGEPAIFVDLRHQQPAPGNAWMFQELAAREDVAAPPTRLIPHDQFDGLILIETLSPPQYID